MKKRIPVLLVVVVMIGCWTGCKSSTSTQDTVALITPYDSTPVLPTQTSKKSDTIFVAPEEYDSATVLYDAVAADIDAAVMDEELQSTLDSVKSLL